MRLIKLTKVYGLDDFEDIYLNVDEIGSFQKEKTDNYTMLFVKHNRILYEFKETPEEIIELIKNSEEI
ncbi:hypothetical protein CIRMBP1248_02527 [Enterococcus cecorum]|uniref:Uncharacterized protein n=1 Tax=Enterococcus cecorum TaxID=44008 RepID=A0A7X9RM94_9ENTE|nr:hypothetical protein [Enterococcus cecorum]MCJ0538481.1 hypothetical protein [Enterococcus cecorum]MCJ0546736.1 hypothetical protein [Enterococcus cecorum]MCJ0551537.1 hypothetical protein [Enterococcus cecorum]MDZ5584806.1 hypothetical protein [Enterococcus cecorum]MDZ5599732.1 hypothetical protein [Enterococcus cecorum]